MQSAAHPPRRHAVRWGRWLALLFLLVAAVLARVLWNASRDPIVRTATRACRLVCGYAAAAGVPLRFGVPPDVWLVAIGPASAAR